MNEAPAVELHIVRNFEPPGGMGEAGASAIVPAVTNAIFAATGKRLRKPAGRFRRVEAAGVSGLPPGLPEQTLLMNGDKLGSRSLMPVARRGLFGVAARTP
jgi:hypothetical protein